MVGTSVSIQTIIELKRDLSSMDTSENFLVKNRAFKKLFFTFQKNRNDKRNCYPNSIFTNMEKSVCLIKMTDSGGKCHYFKMHEIYSVSNSSREFFKKIIVDIVEILFLHGIILCI